jgi:hypothetical protein
MSDIGMTVTKKPAQDVAKGINVACGAIQTPTPSTTTT